MPRLTQEQYEHPPVGSGCARILAIQASRPTHVITVQEAAAHLEPKQQRIGAGNTHQLQTNTGLAGGRVRPGESMDDACLRECDEEVAGSGEFVDGMPARSIRWEIDATSGICKIVRRKRSSNVFETIGELLGVSPFYLNVAADQSEHRLYIALIREAGEELRTEGIPQESLPPEWTSTLNLFSHRKDSPYHFTHRVLGAHGYLYFLEHLLPELSRRVHELAVFQGSREEFEARDAATYFLSRCADKFQR